ncbi:DUF2634 domain-containing protein [Caproiciproducens galactitolivorans]|uniref:DUF2634 domain-containing protein n=1 Tax=Caproiciproducens galactitolivorans TaxID=642589 RepID=A0A4Z0XYA0_9FIRM|nr:DUF2634 domain-containing protein [Caproiciproducens galactitolivorans]QEY33739.1 DUF2634 domain-containing protein [Caproiciproducens galactitolivorans]TGJ75477.1 hypothetical protein CAGA_23560 [Caproiciproducens galactitolivorans]
MILANTVTVDLKLSDEIEQTQTYKVLPDKIQGVADGLTALQQTIDHMLNTEQFEYPIYTLDYGLRTDDLIGKDREYVESELQRRIRECLITDDRITGVDNFQFSVEGDEMLCTFDVESIYKTISMSKAVTA